MTKTALKKKSPAFQKGYSDAIKGEEAEYPLYRYNTDKADYQKGVIAAKQYNERKWLKMKQDALIASIHKDRAYRKKHLGYKWCDSTGKSLEVASLTEIEAKDALCECLDLIEEIEGMKNGLDNMLHKFYGT